MDLYLTAMYVGILTYVFMLITFLIGLRVIKLGFKKHKVFAIITLILATLHGGTLIYYNFF